MSGFTVKAAAKKKDVPDAKYGPSVVYSLTLTDDAGIDRDCEWFTKAATPLPEIGSQLEGNIEPGEYGAKFRKAFTGGGGGGGFKPDPERSRRIERQHSQSVAVDYARLLHERGKLGPDFGLSELRTIIDWFAGDVDHVPAHKRLAHGVTAKEPERTGKSDVPADESDLPWGGEAA